MGIERRAAMLVSFFIKIFGVELSKSSECNCAKRPNEIAPNYRLKFKKSTETLAYIKKKLYLCSAKQKFCRIEPALREYVFRAGEIQDILKKAS